MAELKSQRYEVKDMAEAIELYYAKGWTDGPRWCRQRRIVSGHAGIGRARPEGKSLIENRRAVTRRGGDQYGDGGL